VILAAALFAFALAFLAVIGIERGARAAGLIDRPNHRSSHSTPRPRGGGLGILCGVGAGLLLLLFGGLSLTSAAWLVLGASVPVAAVGLWDDISSIKPLPRLAVQAGAAAAVVWTCGGLDRLPLPAPADVVLGWLGPAAAMMWIVGVTNFFNFMDGADGLAAGQAAIAFGALASVLWPLPLSFVLLTALAATLAFLVRNWSPARIFLGDVGSGWIGFVLAAIPFAGPMENRSALVLLVATGLALFLIDPFVTLIRRWRKGAPLTASHREHAYQRLFAPGESHAPVVSALLAASLALSTAAVLGYTTPWLAWSSLAAALTAGVTEFAVAGARRGAKA
jgi:UDP-N-acetylmuramyl pentapeptide phosphotransferase/UDP-N-acetylglucosamine-1-phosphate transferase